MILTLNSVYTKYFWLPHLFSCFILSGDFCGSFDAIYFVFFPTFWWALWKTTFQRKLNLGIVWSNRKRAKWLYSTTSWPEPKLPMRFFFFFFLFSLFTFWLAKCIKSVKTLHGSKGRQCHFRKHLPSLPPNL